MKGIIAVGVALALVLLSGCGSDSDDAAEDLVDGAEGAFESDDDDDISGLPADDAVIDPAADEGPRDGSIAGRVVEALDGVALAGAEVDLLRFDDGRLVASTVTDAAGDFGFAELARREPYRVALELDGYREERIESVRLSTAETVSLEPVRLVSDDNAGNGGLSGTIVGATDGEALEGITVEFRRGINARTGDVVASATTDAAGFYTVTDIGYGNLTCVIYGPGLQTLYTTVFVLGGIVRDDQNAAVSERVAEGDTEIVLTWGASPEDLDAHLTGPGAEGEPPFHVYFIDERSDVAVLDVDDVSSFGPETITVDASRDAPYRYSVHNFSGGGAGALAASGATVRVLRSSGVVAEFYVPRGEGRLWTVFDLVGGEVVPIDTIGELTSESDYFAPELRTLQRVAVEPVSPTKAP